MVRLLEASPVLVLQVLYLYMQVRNTVLPLLHFLLHLAGSVSNLFTERCSTGCLTTSTIGFQANRLFGHRIWAAY